MGWCVVSIGEIDFCEILCGTTRWGVNRPLLQRTMVHRGAVVTQWPTMN